MQIVKASYADVRHEIRNGDVLLKRGGWTLQETAIAAAGRGYWSHAAMAGWWGGVLMCIETRQWNGGRAVTLSSQVHAAPGRWDVFGLAKVFQDQLDGGKQVGHLALEEMIRKCSRPYGWRSLAGVALRHTPIVRLLLSRTGTDRNCDTAPFCSEAVSHAWRVGAGVDPVANLADDLTEPSDLARSPMFAYRFTLFP